MCRNFKEYPEWEIRENPNLMFGDGECPMAGYIINGDFDCPENCKLHKEVK